MGSIFPFNGMVGNSADKVADLKTLACGQCCFLLRFLSLMGQSPFRHPIELGHTNSHFLETFSRNSQGLEQCQNQIPPPASLPPSPTARMFPSPCSHLIPSFIHTSNKRLSKHPGTHYKKQYSVSENKKHIELSYDPCGSSNSTSEFMTPRHESRDSEGICTPIGIAA